MSTPQRADSFEEPSLVIDCPLADPPPAATTTGLAGQSVQSVQDTESAVNFSSPSPAARKDDPSTTVATAAAVAVSRPAIVPALPPAVPASGAQPAKPTTEKVRPMKMAKTAGGPSASSSSSSSSTALSTLPVPVPVTSARNTSTTAAKPSKPSKAKRKPDGSTSTGQPTANGPDRQANGANGPSAGLVNGLPYHVQQGAVKNSESASIVNRSSRDTIGSVHGKKIKADKTMTPPVQCSMRDASVETKEESVNTEPECLGPCEPGTTVRLDGIVWQETTGGVLVVNINWRGKTYVGTLLDSSKHDWAAPRIGRDSPTISDPNWLPAGSLDRTPSKARSMRRRTTNNSNAGDERKLRNPKATSKKPNGSANGHLDRQPASPAKSDTSTPTGVLAAHASAPNICALVKTKSSSRMSPTDAESSSSEGTGNGPAEDSGATSLTQECPVTGCCKKFREAEAVLFHITNGHSSRLSRSKKSTAVPTTALVSTGSLGAPVKAEKLPVSPPKRANPGATIPAGPTANPSSAKRARKSVPGPPGPLSSWLEPSSAGAVKTLTPPAPATTSAADNANTVNNGALELAALQQSPSAFSDISDAATPSWPATPNKTSAVVSTTTKTSTAGLLSASQTGRPIVSVLQPPSAHNSLLLHRYLDEQAQAQSYSAKERPSSTPGINGTGSPADSRQALGALTAVASAASNGSPLHPSSLMGSADPLAHRRSSLTSTTGMSRASSAPRPSSAMMGAGDLSSMIGLMQPHPSVSDSALQQRLLAGRPSVGSTLVSSVVPSVVSSSDAVADAIAVASSAQAIHHRQQIDQIALLLQQNPMAVLQQSQLAGLSDPSMSSFFGIVPGHVSK